MVGQPPWVWHDFKIRWSSDDVAEAVGVAPTEEFRQTKGTGIK